VHISGINIISCGKIYPEWKNLQKIFCIYTEKGYLCAVKNGIIVFKTHFPGDEE